ncbi:volume-regulated anion channel subunit LRRC8A-like isoform X2 [Xenia sp. Carnegie-2017]|uniref:volume-regulated anion channel subunit LRRC8A-like isoform X2 n=1 Tax=Xenia sp. Carnegie-2017 TaxID=2897299 RepID=UPI001F04E837|nr:volume-regulated anion channel subunit LRRC8A-like isoform X2 [Xenia sp. Carnegie-2017]
MMSMEYFWKGRKVKYKILKPFWDIITDYLVILLAMLSVAVAGMEITSGSFECVAVVDCPHVTKSNLNVTWPQAHLKFPDVCANFYRSQNSNFVARTEVVTDHKVNIIYKSFVNLECRKSAIPKYLSYLWLILFVEALWLLVLNDFWLKLPLTSSVIKTFVDLVMACYDSPSSNFAVTRALFQKNSNRKKSYVRLTMEDTSDLTDQTYNFDFLPDTTSTSEMMGVLDLKKLRELRLDGNCIKKITADIADLENLSILSLKKNHLKKIDPGSLSKIKSLHSLETYGNPDLEHQALRDEVGKLGLSCLFRGKYYRVRNKK